MSSTDRFQNPEVPERCLACILAAGKGRRFGGPKQVADLGGRPLLSWAVEAALGAGLWKVLVVTGHHAAQASDALPQDPCLEILTNPEPEQGMGSSLALAARRALALKARVLVVLLGDMPLIQAATVSQVAALAVKSAAGAAAARIGYRWGHPVAFGRQHFDELASLSGDQGARKLIQRLGPELSLVQAPEWSNLDVDDPGQLEQAGKILQGLRDGTL